MPGAVLSSPSECSKRWGKCFHRMCMCVCERQAPPPTLKMPIVSKSLKLLTLDLTRLNVFSAQKRFWSNVFTRESSYCFQRVLAIAILSVCLSVCNTGGSVKNGASYDHQIFTVTSAAWKTLVSWSAKLFHKFERGSPRTRALNERG